MNDWHPGSAQQKALATVAQCALELRRAQELVRRAGEVLRRANRAAENAKGELGDATRKLTRMDAPMTRAG